MLRNVGLLPVLPWVWVIPGLIFLTFLTVLSSFEQFCSSGIPLESGLNLTFTRRTVNSCSTMNIPPFPLLLGETES